MKVIQFPVSIWVSDKVWKLSRHKGPTFVVHLALADHANKEGICFPSFAHLEKKCRLSRSAVKRAIKELAKSGDVLITQKGRLGKGGEKIKSIYQLASKYLPDKGSVEHSKQGSGRTLNRQGKETSFNEQVDSGDDDRPMTSEEQEAFSIQFQEIRKCLASK